MTDVVRVGIIGVGGIARAAHIPGYQAQTNIEIVALCDIVPGEAAEAALELGVPQAFDSYQEMLSTAKLDAVSVCTPNCTHKETTIAALEAGLHVLCEKPIGMNLGEGQAMASAATKAGKVLQIGLQQRFASDTQALKRFIDAGDLGDIYYGEATYLRRRGIPTWGVFTQKALQGGGALIDIGVHALDKALWLMGNPKPVSVMGATYAAFGHRDDVVSPRGQWDRKKFSVDDMGVALVRFETGATLILRASWAAHIQSNVEGTRVLGTHGGGQLNPLGIYRDLHGSMVDITPTGLVTVKSHTKEIEHFVACVRGECDCIVVPEQVLQVQAILDAIYESARTGEQVRLD